MIYLSDYDSPLGKITLAASSEGIVGAWFAGEKYFLKNIDTREISEGENKYLEEAREWLELYFAKKQPDVKALRLAPEGSEFAKSVWKLLLDVPYGESITYGALAKKMAALRGVEKMSAQAIGGAVGHNPISIIIPCHRVVGTSGNLTGYAAGLDLKVKLLEHEGVDISKFFIPKKGTTH